MRDVKPFYRTNVEVSPSVVALVAVDPDGGCRMLMPTTPNDLGSPTPVTPNTAVQAEHRGRRWVTSASRLNGVALAAHKRATPLRVPPQSWERRPEGGPPRLFDDYAKLPTSSVPILSVTCTTTAPFFIYGLLGLLLVSSPLLA